MARRIYTWPIGVQAVIPDRDYTPDFVVRSQPLMLAALMQRRDLIPASVSFDGPERDHMHQVWLVNASADEIVTPLIFYWRHAKTEARDLWDRFWMVMPLQPHFVTRRWAR